MKNEEVKNQSKNLGLLIILGLIIVMVGLVLLNLKNDREKIEVWQQSEAQLAEVTPEEDRVYGEIVVGEKKMRVEMVDTEAKITTGLSYRDEIGADGMLFVMPTRSIPSFWMKGMRFALDLVWIDCGEGFRQRAQNSGGGCRVVDVSENVLVEEDPNKPKNFYSPNDPVTHVLEVNAVSSSGRFEVGNPVTIDR